MIIHLKEGIEEKRVQDLAKSVNAIYFNDGDRYILINSAKNKTLLQSIEAEVDQHFSFDTDIQLASRDYLKDTREVTIDDSIIGGKEDNTLVITGPCSIESKEQIEDCARFNKSLGISILRAGCFKPRTSPYSFQGLGSEGLELLREVGNKYGLKIISEVRDGSHIDEVIESVDIVQIGAKAMYDQGILRKCGQSRKPILLKRGFGTTLQEFVQAAEFILSLGNSQVILCERGIRTFETKTRFTLDLCGVAYLKKHVNLPVFLDPSHAMGYAYGVPDLTRACVAMGIDGLLIESHPNPSVALSDASQQLDFETFENLFKTLSPIAAAIAKTII